MDTMNTPDSVAGEPREEPVQPVQPDPAAASAAAATSEPAPRVPVVRKIEREVTLERGVRYGRVLIGFAVAGSMLAMLASLLIPLAGDANYTLGQIVGFMALIGAVVGLAVGSIVSVVLGAIAKRRTGTGVAIQTDVQ